MIIEVKIPSPGESVTEVQLAEWLVQDGDVVDKDSELVMIDSDKASFAIYAEESGQVKLLAKNGDKLKVGQVICTINTEIRSQKLEVKSQKSNISKEQNDIKLTSEPQSNKAAIKRISPLAKRMIEELKLNIAEIRKSINKDKITKEDINEFIKSANQQISRSSNSNGRETVREKMSTLRLKLSQRLVAVKNETAMLTTFNEVNMSAVIKIRNQYKEAFKQKYGASLGMTSFFAKACSVALQEFSVINAMIDGEEIVYNKFVDIGIAVSSLKGLIVPVIRDVQKLSLTEIELRINELADKTRKNRITLEELTGGTFTITNGGVFGSMLSTPILNPPQSAILGMHNIVERPVAISGKVEIQPVMYIALSYDHRLIDGKDSVTFLMKVKQLLENTYEALLKEDEFKI